MCEASPSLFYFPKKQPRRTWFCHGAPGEVEMAMKSGVGRFSGALTSSAHLGRSRARGSPARCPYHRTQGTWSETSLGPGCCCCWCWSSRTLPPWSTPFLAIFLLAGHGAAHLQLPFGITSLPAGYPVSLPLCTFLSFSAGASCPDPGGLHGLCR